MELKCFAYDGQEIELEQLDKWMRSEKVDCYLISKSLLTTLGKTNLPVHNKNNGTRDIIKFINEILIKYTHLNKTNRIQIPVYQFINYFSRKKYQNYMEILEDLNICKNVPYNSGKKYFPGFEHNGKKHEGICKQYDVSVPDHDLCLIVFDKLMKPKLSCDIKVDPRMKKTIKFIELNYKTYFEYEMNRYNQGGISFESFKWRIVKALSLNNSRSISLTGTNRIQHSLSNLPKTARPYLHIPMNSFDIKTSQPIFSIIYFIQEGHDFDELYKTHCEDGTLYNQLNIKNIKERRELKEAIFQNIFYGWNERSLFNKKFKELYPKTWGTFKMINEYGGEDNLARRLQRIEASLINTLVPEKSKYWYPLYDSIYFSNGYDWQQLQKSIITYFNSFNVRVSIHSDIWTFGN